MHVAVSFSVQITSCYWRHYTPFMQQRDTCLHTISLGLYKKDINNVALHSVAVRCKRSLQRDRTSRGLEVVRNM
jgi:hypothetical protein